MLAWLLLSRGKCIQKGSTVSRPYSTPQDLLLYDKCTSLGVDYVFIIILLLLYLVSESVELGQNDNKHMFVLLVLIYNMYILVLFKLKP